MTTQVFVRKNRFNHETLNEIGLEGVKALYDLPELIAKLVDNKIKPTSSDYCQLEDDVPSVGMQVVSKFIMTIQRTKTITATHVRNTVIFIVF